MSNVTPPPPYLSKSACVIAGNGESLREIDYRRIPKNLPIFRCNQFYMEDKYYLGKRVDKWFFRGKHFLENYYTAMKLKDKNEYEIRKMILDFNDLFDNFKFHRADIFFEEKLLNIDSFNGDVNKALFSKAFPDIEEFSRDVLRGFNEFLVQRYIFDDVFATITIFIIVNGIINGYRDFYITGYDLYSNGTNTYVFGKLEDKEIAGNTIKYAKGSISFEENGYHNTKMELECIEFLQKNYNINLYAVSPNSIITKYIPTAKILDNHCDLTILDKPKDAILDFIIPKALKNKMEAEKLEEQRKQEELARLERLRIEEDRKIAEESIIRKAIIEKMELEKLEIQAQTDSKELLKNRKMNEARNNIFLKLIKDLFYMPRDIIRHIKYRK